MRAAVPIRQRTEQRVRATRVADRADSLVAPEGRNMIGSLAISDQNEPTGRFDRNP